MSYLDQPLSMSPIVLVPNHITHEEYDITFNTMLTCLSKSTTQKSGMGARLGNSSMTSRISSVELVWLLLI